MYVTFCLADETDVMTDHDSRLISDSLPVINSAIIPWNSEYNEKVITTLQLTTYFRRTTN